MALLLDGKNRGNTGGALSLGVSLTTSNGSGVIVAAVISNQSISSVTAPGLTFGSARATANDSGNITTIFTAPYTSNFSGTITANASAITFLSLIVWGISGAATSSYFDSSASFPLVNNTSTNVSAAFSTNNANDFLFIAGVTTSSFGTDSFTDSNSNTWTIIEDTANDFAFSAYLITSTTVSSITVKNNTNNMAGFVVDSIIQASAATESLFRPPNLDGISTGGPFFANPLARSMLGWRKRAPLWIPERGLVYG